VAAQLSGLPPQLLEAIISQENAPRDVGAVSHPAADQAQTPAHGLMQVTPGTFRSIRPQVERLLGREASVSNPFDNLLGGALLWRKYLDQTDGDVEAAARLYHGGENPAGHGPRTRQYGLEVAEKFAAATRGR
jgi:soluble lytic murein transglycosylase-like protein